MEKKSDYENAKEYLGYLIDIRRTFLENYKDELRSFIQFCISLMSVLGIMAGFGFTAFRFIESLLIFFIGEMLVIGSILYLIWKVKAIIASQPIDTEKYINDSVDKARKIKKALIENNNEKIVELSDEFHENVFDVSETPKMKAAKTLEGFLEKSILIGGLGIFLIIFSFLGNFQQISHFFDVINTQSLHNIITLIITLMLP